MRSRMREKSSRLPMVKNTPGLDDLAVHNSVDLYTSAEVYMNELLGPFPTRKQTTVWHTRQTVVHYTQ